MKVHRPPRFQDREATMTAYYLGNLCAALVTVGLLVGTLRFTRRLS